MRSRRTLVNVTSVPHFSQTTPRVLDRAEDGGTEKAVPLWLEGTIIDRLGLLDLPVGPGADQVGRRQANPNRFKIQRLPLSSVQIE
jgi:hypothetical protein